MFVCRIYCLAGFSTHDWLTTKWLLTHERNYQQIHNSLSPVCIRDGTLPRQQALRGSITVCGPRVNPLPWAGCEKNYALPNTVNNELCSSQRTPVRTLAARALINLPCIYGFISPHRRLCCLKINRLMSSISVGDLRIQNALCVYLHSQTNVQANSHGHKAHITSQA